jgi:MFS family permease
VYALSLFLPTIIKGLGYSSALAQLMTIPVYALASMTCIIVGYFSDRLGQRSLFTLICYGFVFVGYLFAVAPKKFIPSLTYTGTFIAAAGIYPGKARGPPGPKHHNHFPISDAFCYVAIPGLLALSSNNYAPATKRAVGVALQIGLGTLAGAAASNFYRKNDAPRYRMGHSLVLGFVGLGLLSSTAYYLLCRRANAMRKRQSVSLSPEEVCKLGDKAPSFQYKL